MNCIGYTAWYILKAMVVQGCTLNEKRTGKSLAYHANKVFHFPIRYTHWEFPSKMFTF